MIKNNNFVTSIVCPKCHKVVKTRIGVKLRYHFCYNWTWGGCTGLFLYGNKSSFEKIDYLVKWDRFKGFFCLHCNYWYSKKEQSKILNYFSNLYIIRELKNANLKP